MAAKSRSVFDYDDYKKYLGVVLDTAGESRGMRSKLASALGCQTAFISQVLNGHVHFSLEHAVLINQFLQHNRAQSHFFMLLVHLARSGSAKLREYYQQQIDEIRKKRQETEERIMNVHRHVVPLRFQVEYASSWHNGAIYAMSAIPRFQDARAVAEYLNLPLSYVRDRFEFLVEAGLLARSGDKYVRAKNRLTLGSDSPFNRLLINHAPGQPPA